MRLFSGAAKKIFMSGGFGLGCGVDMQARTRSDACEKSKHWKQPGWWLGMMVVLAWWLGAGVTAEAASAKISKVLPHLLDRQGRHALSPSLYERDAYQEHLRGRPEEVMGMRFDVRWNVSRELADGLRLRVELRGTGQPEVIMVEQPVERRPWYNRWSAVALDEATFSRMGRLIAWRVSLWRGPEMIAEQRSFLW